MGKKDGEDRGMNIAVSAIICAAVICLGIKHFWEKKVFVLLAAASSLCLALSVFYQIGYERTEVESLIRNEPGAGNSVETLRVEVAGGDEMDITLDVPQLEVSQSRAEVLLRTAASRVQKLVPEDGNIEGGIDLPSSYEDLGVNISWYSSDYMILDSRGHIGTDVQEAGSEVTLTCLMKAGIYEKEMSFDLVVFPDDDLPLSERIIKSVQNANEGSNDASYILPDELDGDELVWYRPDDYRVAVFSALILLSGLFIHVRKREKKKSGEEQRRTALKKEYPEFVSRLLLLMYSGLACRQAFARISRRHKERENDPAYRSFSCEEAAAVCSEMERGISEQEAYRRMGERCAVSSYKVLSMLLAQNLKHGSAGIVERLEAETLQAYEERKRNARAEGERISVRLILPMGMMLVTVLIILIFPSMASAG